MSDDYKGYRDPAKSVLIDNNVRVWSDVEMETRRGGFKGIILPRSETADNTHIVLKLANGYNIGVTVDNVVNIKELSHKEAQYKIPEKDIIKDIWLSVVNSC